MASNIQVFIHNLLMLQDNYCQFPELELEIIVQYTDGTFDFSFHLLIYNCLHYVIQADRFQTVEMMQLGHLNVTFVFKRKFSNLFQTEDCDFINWTTVHSLFCLMHLSCETAQFDALMRNELTKEKTEQFKVEWSAK